MNPREQEHWQKRLIEYRNDSWAGKPSLFAEYVRPFLPDRGTLLECGAAAGQDSIWFAQQGFTVTSTDVIDGAFNHIQTEAQRMGVRLNQKVVDLWEDLPFKDNSFDVVYAQLCLQYFTKSRTEEIFEEILRVLKRGGVLAAMFNSKADPEYGKGTAIEPDYFEVGKLRKRYFDTESVKQYAKHFTIVVLDNQGESYKDGAKGVHHMIRLVAKKGNEA